MIDENEYKKAVSEVLMILQYSDEEIIEKIPLEVIKKLKQDKSSTYNPDIDFIKNLDINNLRKETLTLLASLYRDYICTEEEREEIDEILEKSSKVKCKNEDMFENKQKTEENKPNELMVLEQQKTLWQKIVEKLFKKK